jgi:hypothetical protein
VTARVILSPVMQARLQGLFYALVALGWLFLQRDITCTRVCTGDALRRVHQDLHIAEFAAVVDTAIETAKQLLQRVNQELIKLLAAIHDWVNRFDNLAQTAAAAVDETAAAAAASAAVPVSKTRMAFGVTAFRVLGLKFRVYCHERYVIKQREGRLVA